MDLLEGITLAKYQSNKFSAVVLVNDTDGPNHQWAPSHCNGQKVHADLLKQYAKYMKTKSLMLSIALYHQEPLVSLCICMIPMFEKLKLISYSNL